MDQASSTLLRAHNPESHQAAVSLFEFSYEQLREQKVARDTLLWSTATAKAATGEYHLLRATVNSNDHDHDYQ